jgi:hypothetical protein
MVPGVWVDIEGRTVGNAWVLVSCGVHFVGVGGTVLLGSWVFHTKGARVLLGVFTGVGASAGRVVLELLGVFVVMDKEIIPGHTQQINTKETKMPAIHLFLRLF